MTDIIENSKSESGNSSFQSEDLSEISKEINDKLNKCNECFFCQTYSNEVLSALI